MRRAVSEQLTPHQRQIFVALIVDDVPLDALVTELGSNRNAIYKTMFDARRKLHAALVANGHLRRLRDRRRARASTEGGAKTMSEWVELEQFLRTDPRDVGCDEALRLLHVYVEVVFDDGSEEAARRYPGVAEHLRACGPCDEDFEGLLVAVRTVGTDETDRDERP